MLILVRTREKDKIYWSVWVVSGFGDLFHPLTPKF